MVTIYGIKNCDTVQKALKWLNANKVAYKFHDYKVSGIDEATLEKWLQHFPIDKLINLRSTTYKELPDEEKKGIETRGGAINLMLSHHSIIKRPLWDFGNGTFYLGWNEAELGKMLLG